MRRSWIVGILALAGACSHSATAPDHCQREMKDQQSSRGAPQQTDFGPAYERWTYITSMSRYVVFFDWSSGSCVVSYPQ